MNPFKLKIGITLSLALLAAIVGVIVGFFLWRTITLRQAMIELDHHALRYMMRSEDSSAASDRFLKTLSATHFAPCSAAEISFMHHLLIQSDYIKDMGRMVDGKVACDANLTPTELPTSAFTPAFVLQDGTRVYTDVRFVREDPESRVAVEKGGFFVIFLHWRPDRLGNLPIDFTLTEVGNGNVKPGWLHGEHPQASAAMLSRTGWATFDGRLYATHCSPHYFNCFTAFAPVDKVLSGARTQEAESATAGGSAGILTAFLGMAFYLRNRSLVSQLRRAIRREKLRVVYQPIVRLADRQVVGAEALVRWVDDDGYEVSPTLFVPIAEANGFVNELTRLVIRLVLRDMSATLRAHPDFSISINVTGLDLVDERFVPTLQELLAEYGVAASSLTIEITESSTADKQTAVATIHRLSKNGHRVHIDDFGTGYSSLSYLHTLAVDAIKIDKSFTRAIGTEAVTASILPQILAIAQKLQLEVIVEGIETQTQADYFSRCEQPVLGQGWLYSHPGPAAHLHRLLETGPAAASSP